MMTQCRENSLTSWIPWESTGVSQRCTSWGEARWRQPRGPVLCESEGESALTLEMKGMAEVRTWADTEVLPGTLVVTVNALSLPGEGASPAEVQGWMLSFWNHVLVVIWKLFGILSSHLSFWTLKFNIMQLTPNDGVGLLSRDSIFGGVALELLPAEYHRLRAGGDWGAHRSRRRCMSLWDDLLFRSLAFHVGKPGSSIKLNLKCFE